MAASTSPPTTTTPAAPPQTTPNATIPPPLPSAHLLDISPPLHALLSRLEPSLSTYTHTSPLSPKELTTQAQAVKARIRKAVAAIAKLGDVERGTEEQEEEIRELEERIGRQKEMLRGLGVRAEALREGKEV